MNESQVDWRAALAAYIACEAKPVEKYGHQPRLYELTRKIGSGLAYDDDVVFAAVWLHDLGVFEGHRPQDRDALEQWDCVAYAVQAAPALLLELGFPTGKTVAVVECIQTHQAQFQPASVEAAILRDADILEQLGSVGILRTVCKVGRDTRYETFSSIVPVLRRALDTLPGMLQLPASRELAEERCRVHRAFLDSIANEAGELLF